MKQFKFLLLAFFMMGFISITQAQSATKSKIKTSKSKKAKSSDHAHAVKYQCPMKCEGEKTYDHAGKCPVCNMKLKALEAKATAYQCPMKCEGEKTYGKEGKCPVCNMNLKAVAINEKKKEEDHAGHSH